MRDIRDVNVNDIFWNFPSIDDNDNTTRKFSRTVLYKQKFKFIMKITGEIQHFLQE